MFFFVLFQRREGPSDIGPVTRLFPRFDVGLNAGGGEVVLLGQTVDSYRDPKPPPPFSDNPDESQFPALLEAIYSRVPGLSRLRYTSPHPRHVTPSLAKAHQTIPILAQHVHLPVQSGSNRIFEANDSAPYACGVPGTYRPPPCGCLGITFSTDLIVGFPGETAEDFESTLSLVEEVGFVSLFAFKYSARPGTPALRLGDDVTESEKSERLARLLELSSRLTESHLLGLVGSEQTVLVEGHSRVWRLSRSRAVAALGDCSRSGRERRGSFAPTRSCRARARP